MAGLGHAFKATGNIYITFCKHFGGFMAKSPKLERYLVDLMTLGFLFLLKKHMFIGTFLLDFGSRTRLLYFFMQLRITLCSLGGRIRTGLYFQVTAGQMKMTRKLSCFWNSERFALFVLIEQMTQKWRINNSWTMIFTLDDLCLMDQTWTFMETNLNCTVMLL